MFEDLEFKRELQCKRGFKENLRWSKAKRPFKRTTEHTTPVVFGPLHANEIPTPNDISNEKARGPMEAHPSLRTVERVTFRRLRVEPMRMCLFSCYIAWKT